MSKGILILSGYNIRAVVAFCRWALEQHVPFHIVARNELDPMFLTAFRESIFLIREHDHLELDDFCGWISRIREQYSYQEVLVLPSTEFLNRFMINNQVAIELVGGIVPLVNKELYESISDKYNFGKKCLDFGIPVPEEYQVMPADFPFVAKPRNYASINKRQLKPYLIYNSSNLADFRQNESKEDYFFQQYIEGDSLYLLASIPQNGEVALFAQKNLIQQTNGGSVILARTDDFHKLPMAVQFLQLLAEIDFHGLIMIEVRFHKGMQKHFMIEANPRLWGPIQLVVDNGIDIFGSFLRDYGFKVNCSSNQIEHAPFYFWSGGLIDTAKPFAYHNYSSDRFIDEFNLIMRYNLFLREDTFDLFHDELFKLDELENGNNMSQYSLSELYNRTSKHGNYQVLARPLRAIVQQENIKVITRYEIERLDFILSRCSVAGKVIADIGGNTGFFSLECVAHGASAVMYFEGNEAHSEFVRRVVNTLNMDKVVTVFSKYLQFRDDFNCLVDVCFLLNVLHHIGDDYGDSAISRDEAKKEILESLSYMSRKARMLIFQLGFNWKGDRNLPLFEHGTKAELIDFIREGTADDWEILNIGIANRTESSVEYQELNETNIQRDDRLGEFLNRPIFIMRSICATTN